jgi:hypothetical protein
MGQEVRLRCDTSITLFGYSFGINYDETKVRVTAVSLMGTAAEGADFFDGSIDVPRGLVGYGCILDTSGDFQKRIEPGTGLVLAVLTVDILATTDDEAQMAFESVQIEPPPHRPVRNLMTDSEGFSVVPAVQHGVIRIETRVPVITAIQDNSGLEGKVFQVVGEFFGEPGRQVTVCGASASATLRPDRRTLDVTAPECATIGCVELRVCTVRGCDSEPQGFCYLRPPPPTITTIDPDQGRSGTLFVISGQHFDRRGLAVTVCGAPAQHHPPMDGNTRLEVVAPDCPTTGPADVQVCTDFGCATRPGGFTYVSDPVPVISSIAPNEGRTGTTFTISGENFDRPGLLVRVCDVAASHTPPRNGGTELDVTAPPCAVGPADVEVCTDVGCTRVPGGFRYLPDPVPRIVSVEPSEGPAGTAVTITGENFDQPGLVVRICEVEASHGPPRNGGTAIDVTVPVCPRSGPADVEVCNQFGCDVLAGGFTYLVPPGTRFVRGDVDSSGSIDISDGIRVLNFLFSGGRAPACFDAADSDDRGDLNITDGIRIFNWLFTGGVAPPPPSPSATDYPPGDCGIDPTGSDPLDCAAAAPQCGT